MAAHPFLARPGLPRETDAELHVFRAAELGYALRGGAGYVRWAPNLWYGYGYPIFNYYAPLTYYLANAFALWPGASIVDGTKAVFVLGLALAALGAFGLGRDLFGPRAGLTAAVAYVFSPYLLLIEPHLRGDLPELLALALFPWLIKFTISDRPQPTAGFLLASAVWATLIFTHPLMALILSVIFVAWLVWRFAFSPPGERSRQAFHITRLILLAAGLSAFFWLPFVAERNAIHLRVIGAGYFDFHNHFVAWQALLEPSRALDLGAAAPQYQHNLGLAQWMLALPAIPLAVLYRRHPQGQAMAFFAASSLVLIFLMLSPSTFIWENVPLMPYIQFPWRLLGPAALTLAMCIAGVTWGVEETCKRPASHLPPSSFRLHPSAFILLLLALALPTMYPPMWPPDFGPTTPRDILQVELAGRYLGTTSSGDFLPSTVRVDPPANPDLIASYDQALVNKFDSRSLPAGATAQVLEHGPARDRFAVSSPQPFTARVLTFYFPGWQARVDGQPAPIRPSDPHGFIELDLPAGSHDVLLTFGSTLPRRLGALISLLAFVAAGLGAWHVTFYVSRFRSPQPPSTFHRLEFRDLEVEALILVAFVAFKFIVADPCDTCFRYTSPPGQVLGAQHKLDPPVDLGHHIILMGYDLPSDQVCSGDKLTLTLYWKASAPVPKNYQVFAHLTRPAVTLWGQSDKLNPGDAPTTRWPLDKFIWDSHTLAVLPGTPPGDYELSVGLYTLSDGARAPVFDASGQLIGDSVALPTPVRVLPARTRRQDLAMDKRDDIAYNGATLLGHALESADVSAPGFVRVTLFWQADADAPPQPAQVRVSLVDEQGQTIAYVESEPTGRICPPARWKRGQIVRDIYSLWLGDSIPAGIYAVRLTVDGTQALDLAQVRVAGKQ